MIETQAVAELEEAEKTYQRGGPTAIFAKLRDGGINAILAAKVVRRSRMSFKQRTSRLLARTLSSLLD